MAKPRPYRGVTAGERAKWLGTMTTKMALVVASMAAKKPDTDINAVAIVGLSMVIKQLLRERKETRAIARSLRKILEV